MFHDAAASCTHFSFICALQRCRRRRPGRLRCRRLQSLAKRPSTLHPLQPYTFHFRSSFQPRVDSHSETYMKSTWVYVPFPYTPIMDGDPLKGMSIRLESIVAHLYGSPNHYSSDTLNIVPHLSIFYNDAHAELWKHQQLRVPFRSHQKQQKCLCRQHRQSTFIMERK